MSVLQVGTLKPSLVATLAVVVRRPGAARG